MKKKIILISAVLLVLAFVIIFAFPYKTPLATIDNIIASEELNQFNNHSYNGKSFYYTKNGMSCEDGELSEEQLKKSERSFEEWQQNELQKLAELVIPENEEQMSKQWPGNKNYACWRTFFLIVQAEYPEYYIMPKSVFYESVKSEEFLKCAKKIYRTKRLNKFQKNIFKKAIEVLDLINLKK